MTATTPIATVFAQLDDSQPFAQATIRAYSQLAWFVATHRAAKDTTSNHQNQAERYGFEPAENNPNGYAPHALAAMHAATAVANANDPNQNTQITASIVAAALVVSSTSDHLVSDVANAIAHGHDVASRIVATLTNHTAYNITHTACVLGAVTAATMLSTNDATVRANAYGIASTQAARLNNVTSDSPEQIAADATDTAVEAALLAAHGFTGATSGIDGRRGVLPIIAETAPLAQLHETPKTMHGVSFDGADTIDETLNAATFYTTHLI